MRPRPASQLACPLGNRRMTQAQPRPLALEAGPRRHGRARRSSMAGPRARARGAPRSGDAVPAGCRRRSSRWWGDPQLRRRHGARQGLDHRAPGRVPDHPWAERLGQDHAAADHLGPGDADPTEQALPIAGRDVPNVPAADRNCTTVFQHYALFPHMSVGENVEYGLKVRGVPKGRAPRARGRGAGPGPLGDKYGRRVASAPGGERRWRSPGRW